MTIEFGYDTADALTRAKAAITGADLMASKLGEMMDEGPVSAEIADGIADAAKMALQAGTVHALISIAESLATLTDRGIETFMLDEDGHRR